jgi:hypothetical protein
MKDLFQRHKSGDTARIAKSAAPRLTLGAFGKHPGWDDHILGIGVETETLAQVKQALYVGGIGGQIDSGAWEKLEPEKRLIGYDHTFLWLRLGHVILGRLWSSTDGKGRAKYPMVLCIDGEAVAPGFMLTHLLPGLERLREACKATTSADQVTKDCRAAQEQLRAILSSADPRLAEAALPVEARRRFLERPELGPDRLGFLRALHELGTGPSVRSRHLRLPLASDSRAESLALWGAFFRCAVSDTSPLVLISRAGVNWIDVIIGEPTSDDFFCLQASNKAMPLATEIPYELAPDSKQRMQGLEARFLDVEPPRAAVVPAPSPKAQVPSAPAAHPSPGAATPPAKWTWPFFIIGGVVLAGLAALAWFSFGGSHSTATGPTITVASKQSAQQPQTNVNNQAKEQVRECQIAKAAATGAEGTNDWILAVRLWNEAGKKCPGEQEITNGMAFAAAMTNALELVNQARGLTNSQPTNAVALCNLALEKLQPARQWATGGVRSQAVASVNLDLSQVQRGAATAVTALADQQKCQEAKANARKAEDAGQWAEAVRLWAAARISCPGDLAVTNDMAFGSAMTNALELVNRARGLTNRQPTNAVALCNSALENLQPVRQWVTGVVRSNAVAALKTEADHAKTAAQNEIAKEQQKKKDLDEAKGFFAKGNYDEALRLCASHPGVAEFDNLAETNRIEQKAFNEANASFTKGDYSFIEPLKKQSYSGEKPFDDLLAKAVEENKVLEELKALKQATNWTAVTNRLAGVAFQKKPPFTDLAKWAETQRQLAPKQLLEKLDAELAKYLVQFRILRPTDAKFRTITVPNVEPITMAIGYAQGQYYLDKVKSLEREFKANGWLDQNRQQNLDKLEKVILLME